MRVKNETWWQLLERIENAIRREPENYCQARFVINPEQTAVRKDVGLPTNSRCGTAYCIAGWGGQLMEDHYSSFIRGLEKITSTFDMMELTSGGALYQYFEFEDGESVKLFPGTREYAQAGIIHLRKFMTKWEKVLKSNHVTYENRAN